MSKKQWAVRANSINPYLNQGCWIFESKAADSGSKRRIATAKLSTATIKPARAHLYVPLRHPLRASEKFSTSGAWLEASNRDTHPQAARARQTCHRQATDSGVPACQIACCTSPGSAQSHHAINVPEQRGRKPLDARKRMFFSLFGRGVVNELAHRNNIRFSGAPTLLSTFESDSQSTSPPRPPVTTLNPELAGGAGQIRSTRPRKKRTGRTAAPSNLPAGAPCPNLKTLHAGSAAVLHRGAAQRFSYVPRRPATTPGIVPHPSKDYSTAWAIGIPCAGVVLILLAGPSLAWLYGARLARAVCPLSFSFREPNYRILARI